MGEAHLSGRSSDFVDETGRDGGFDMLEDVVFGEVGDFGDEVYPELASDNRSSSQRGVRVV